ncbi:MAG TPA: response regulator [Balneola sp.]|jgi:CheY-like chemotaxis protein|nr:response regulator [Balneola sp.]MAO76457.1 response regulator [Balneola sp.]MBF65648.1 response regulator [Balneola sp.]HAH50105.1 response regulator [Balneola sp.]HAW80583.1 response regulator [Balneola sp.]|tara:strand:+ start:8529 stop:8903 length:375 start_codon:yes stop_codon:yes gene_type:complete
MKKAIIVEDNLLISVIYRHYLEKMKYKVIDEVTTGERAVEILRTQDVDLILMDIMLDGEINGIDAMSEIRKFTASPVIFASGNSDSISMNKAAEISNSVFLVKPVTEFDFIQGVEKVLGFKSLA